MTSNDQEHVRTVKRRNKGIHTLKCLGGQGPTCILFEPGPPAALALPQNSSLDLRVAWHASLSARVSFWSCSLVFKLKCTHIPLQNLSAQDRS